MTSFQITIHSLLQFAKAKGLSDLENRLKLVLNKEIEKSFERGE